VKAPRAENGERRAGNRRGERGNGSGREREEKKRTNQQAKLY
jgi:hypothetical protein